MSRTDDDNLEDLLRQHAVRGPAPELRQRVIGLRSSRSFFWEAAAASLLVGACLVQIVSSRPAVRQAAIPAPDLSAIREALRQDYSEEEVELATATLASAASLHPLPDVQTNLAPTMTRAREELR